jgi:hypothetical protein
MGKTYFITQTNNLYINNILYIDMYFIIQQRSSEHFNILILLRCNFNNFVTLSKYKVYTP